MAEWELPLYGSTGEDKPIYDDDRWTDKYAPLYGRGTYVMATDNDHRSDCRFRALRDEFGFEGHINDMMLEWYKQNGAGPDTDNLADAFMECAMFQLGDTDGHRNDLWMRIMEISGATAPTLPDRSHQFWCEFKGYLLPDEGSDAEWIRPIPDPIIYYENDKPHTLDLRGYVRSNPVDDPVVFSVTPTGGADQPTVSGSILTMNSDAGNYGRFTAKVNNATGEVSDSNPFSYNVLAGALPVAPDWGPIPDYYSVEGVGGGNTVPPPLNPAQAQVLSPRADEPGVEMIQYILNQSTHPITEGSWQVEAGSEAVDLVDQATGRLLGRADVTDGDYDIRVSVANISGLRATCATFTWQVLDNMGLIVDFSTRETGDWLGMDFFRNSTQDFQDYRATTDTAPVEVPAMVGRERTGNTYVEQGVTYGVKIDSGVDPWVKLGGTIGDLSALPSGGMEIEACFQIVFRVDAVPLSGPNNIGRIFSLNSEADGDDISEIVLYENTPGASGSLALGVRTNKTDNIGTNGFASAVAVIPNMAVGDVIDIRGRVQRPGGTGQADRPIEWRAYRNDSATPVATATSTVFPTISQKAAMDRLDIGGIIRSTTLEYNSNITAIYCRLVPTGYLTDAIIWPGDDGEDPKFLFWRQPAPVITAENQPQSLTFGDSGETTPVTIDNYPTSVNVLAGADCVINLTASGTAPIQYSYTIGVQPIKDVYPNVIGETTAQLTIPANTIPELNTVSIVGRVSNLGGTQTAMTAPIPVTQLAAAAPGMPGDPALLFTDIIDGVNQGWFGPGDTTRGAAITLYGAFMGAAPEIRMTPIAGGAPYIIPNGDIVEASAPSFVPNLFMTTFWLNGSIPPGDYNISLINPAQDAEAESEGLPFTVRTNGVIYFVDSSIDIGNGPGVPDEVGPPAGRDGTHANPFVNFAEIFYSGHPVVAGDHVYVRGGRAGPGSAEDNAYTQTYNLKIHNEILNFYNNPLRGQPGNHISIMGYPGDEPPILDTSYRMQPDLKGNIGSKTDQGIYFDMWKLRPVRMGAGNKQDDEGYTPGAPLWRTHPDYVGGDPWDDRRGWIVLGKMDLYGVGGSIAYSDTKHFRMIGLRANGVQYKNATGDVGDGSGNDSCNFAYFMGGCIRHGSCGSEQTHAWYPGGGQADDGNRTIFAYNYMYGNNYENSRQLSFNTGQGNNQRDVPSHDRVPWYRRQRGAEIHHNLLDMRGDPGLTDANGTNHFLGFNMSMAFGLNRHDNRNPEYNEHFGDSDTYGYDAIYSAPILVYNNLIISGTEPNEVGTKGVSGCRHTGSTYRVESHNNTYLWGGDGACVNTENGNIPSLDPGVDNLDSDTYIVQRIFNASGDVFEITGTEGDAGTTAYYAHSTGASRPAEWRATGGVYFKGDGSTVPPDMPGEAGNIEGDPKIDYDQSTVGNAHNMPAPAAQPGSLAKDRLPQLAYPAKQLRDFNHRPYPPQGPYDSGAFQVEDE